MLPLDLIWWQEEGDISVHFGWSFLGEQPGRGTILIMLYLSWGLAKGCRVSGGSGRVSVRRGGWAICSPHALRAWPFGSRFCRCPFAVKIMATCLSVKRCLRFPCPEGAPTECLVFPFRRALLPLFLTQYRGLKSPPRKTISSNVPLMDHSHGEWSEQEPLLPPCTWAPQGLILI